MSNIWKDSFCLWTDTFGVWKDTSYINAYNACAHLMETWVAGVRIRAAVVVALDANRVIEYNATNTTWDTIDLVVLGWWI